MKVYEYIWKISEYAQKPTKDPNQHSILRSLMFMKLQSSLNAHHNLEELILNVNLTVTGYLTLNN